MPYVKRPISCLDCGLVFEHAKLLTRHAAEVHGLSSEAYAIKHTHAGIQPACPECGAFTRFQGIRDGFVSHCKEHAKLAMSEAGKRGGKAPAWNKGLTKEDHPTLALQSIKSMGSGNPFFNRKHTSESRVRISAGRRLAFDDVLARIAAVVPTIEVFSGPDEYETQDTPLRVMCMVCMTPASVSSFNIQRSWHCRTCHPLASRQQLEVADFVRSVLPADVEVLVSDRTAIAPLELDVWVPSLRVAVEYHGLYWHSGGREGAFDGRKHRKKYEQARDAGIRLIQVFSDEWRDRRQACESVIEHALGRSSRLLNARDCDVVTLGQPEGDRCLEAWHLAGTTRASLRVGLVHPTVGAVAVASVRRPIQKRWGADLDELARMAFMPGVSVRGGVSRLLAGIRRRRQDTSSGLLSYADLRHGTGAAYERCGLARVGESPKNYWYTDGDVRFDRFKYRAQPGIPERDVADAAGVRAVYGCGNAIYVGKWTDM